jgi:hypothetical protein
MPHGRLMLTVLGGLAQFERTLISARTGEGRERARTRGHRRAAGTDHRSATDKAGHPAGRSDLAVAVSAHVAARQCRLRARHHRRSSAMILEASWIDFMMRG